MITKRQLGIAFLAAGLLGLITLFAVDLLGAGEFQGIGPLQRIGLIGAGVFVLLGASLIPLGNRPA